MSTNTDREVRDESDTERSPWNQPWFLVSAAVIGLLVALLVILLVADMFSDDSEAVEVPAAEAPITGAGIEASPSVCGLDAVADSGTVTQPPAAQWTLVATIAVPSAEGVGPGEVFPDQFRRCFARTPEGALFAAANIVGVSGSFPLEKQVTEWYVAEGPGRAEAVAAAGTHSNPDSTFRLQIAGFRVLNYTGDTATVDIAMRASTGAFASQVYDLVWQDGDWRMRVAPDGEGPLTPVARIPDLAGYIPWGGA